MNKHKKQIICDCKNFIIKNNVILCTKCKKPMKSQPKPITNKGLRHKSGMYNK